MQQSFHYHKPFIGISWFKHYLYGLASKKRKKNQVRQKAQEMLDELIQAVSSNTSVEKCKIFFIEKINGNLEQIIPIKKKQSEWLPN